MPDIRSGGLPHSETPGSMATCAYPGRIAACRVLRRPREPRHPPRALVRSSGAGRGAFPRPARTGTAPSGRRPSRFSSGAPASRRDAPLLVRVQHVKDLPSFPGPEAGGGQKPGPGVSLPARPHREARVYERGKESKAAARGKPRSRKEVFQPHLPVRLPCYDLAPVTGVALVRSSRSRPSGAPGSHGLTGGVYKARERIHRAMADARLLANPAS